MYTQEEDSPLSSTSIPSIQMRFNKQKLPHLCVKIILASPCTRLTHEHTSSKDYQNTEAGPQSSYHEEAEEFQTSNLLVRLKMCCVAKAKS
mmetsp:Transcript_14404/g.18871  ORF Transcript_14404/g.18871 Transcript_14404/m.18871 type:complete len:91 (+) Transcript_14404:167-439(+)